MHADLAKIVQQQFCSPTSDNIKPSCHAVAVWRAVHQLLEQLPVFHDPIALKILGATQTVVREKIHIHKNPLSTAMRIAIAIRSRFAEDERAHSAANQYVILGAGLDTYAYRTNNLHETVFEVDLPEQQAIKMARLKAVDIQPSAKVIYVPCDFEAGALETCLQSAGFDLEKKTFFSWLGVVPYLELAAIEQTLEFVARCKPGSSLVFDYIVDSDNLNDIEKMTLQILSAQLAAGGEPLKTFFNPQQLAQKLSLSGFEQVIDVDAACLNDRYLANRDDGLRIGNVTRLFKVIV